MKTLKWFSLEWCVKCNTIHVSTMYSLFFAHTEQQAFDWLENNGYIERIKGE